MSSYNRMLETIKPLGIYKLDGTTILDCELRAYAREIDKLHEKAETLLESSFVDSPTADTTNRFIQLYSLPKNIEPTTLKNIIYLRNAITNKDFTLDGIKHCLLAGGLTANITENFATNTVTVAVLTDMGIFADNFARNNYIKQVMPCHVKLTVTG